MVLVYIIPKTAKQSEDIVAFLLREKHVLTAMIMRENMLCKLGASGTIKKGAKIMIQAVTRTLHFNALNVSLRKRYENEMPILYSTPIIHMDPDQAEEIVEYIEAF